MGCQDDHNLYVFSFNKSVQHPPTDLLVGVRCQAWLLWPGLAFTSEVTFLEVPAEDSSDSKLSGVLLYGFLSPKVTWHLMANYMLAPGTNFIRKVGAFVSTRNKVGFSVQKNPWFFPKMWCPSDCRKVPPATFRNSPWRTVMPFLTWSQFVELKRFDRFDDYPNHLLSHSIQDHFLMTFFRRFFSEMVTECLLLSTCGKATQTLQRFKVYTVFGLHAAEASRRSQKFVKFCWEFWRVWYANTLSVFCFSSYRCIAFRRLVKRIKKQSSPFSGSNCESH